MGGKVVNINKYKGKHYLNFVKGILVILFTIVTILISMKCVKAISDATEDNSLFFVQLINYTMPIIEKSSFHSEDLAEKNKSFKNEFWNMIGVDMNNPMSYIGKEAAIFNFNVSASETKVVQDEIVSPYKLQEGNVSKQQPQSSADSNISIPDNSKPQVFIYHSHTTESYAPKADNSTDENYNVCAVGNVLESELERNYGVSVIHDKTVHDALGDIDAYSRSRVTLGKYLTKYGDFKLIIDLHRDASANRKNDIVTVNGETAAKAMFVMCLKNPHADKNISVSDKIAELANKAYPNLFKAMYSYNTGVSFYGQDLSNNAVLLEVGTNKNSIDEAKVTAKYLAKIIAAYVKSK